MSVRRILLSWMVFLVMGGAAGVSSVALGATQDPLAPRSWYLEVGDKIKEKVATAFQVDLEKGLYYMDQRIAAVREDVNQSEFIDPISFGLPELGEGLAYLGFARSTFSGSRELWLIKPSQEKFLLAVMDAQTGEWASRKFTDSAHFWAPIRGGILAFDANWRLDIRLHSLKASEPKIELGLEALHHTFDKVGDLPVHFYDPISNRILVAAKAATTDADQYNLYAIDVQSMLIRKLTEGVTWPLHLRNTGVFSLDGDKQLVFRSIDLSRFGDDGLFDPTAKKVYTLRADGEGKVIDSFDFTAENLYVMRPNSAGRNYKYTVNSELELTRYQGENNRFVPSTTQDDELMVGIEHVELARALRTGTRSPLYGQKNVNRFLSDSLGAAKNTWAILRYQQGQLPEELVASYVWEVNTRSVPTESELKHVDRVWEVNGERLFDTGGDEELAADYMRALHDVVRGRNAILFLKDFPTTLETESGAVVPLVKLFYNTFRDCLEKGECRVVMSIREPVYRKLHQSIFDVFAASKQHIVTRLTNDELLEVSQYAASELERKKDLRVTENAFDIITKYAMRLGRTQASPGNELDLLKSLFTFVDTYHAGIREIDRGIVRDWIDHVRGVKSIRESINVEGLRKFLKKKVVGHEEAIDGICDSLKPILNGTHFGNKPLAFHTLIGTPGVGKTYIAKLIAEYLTGPDSLLLVDMRTFSGFSADHPVRQALAGSKSEIRVVLFDDVDQVGAKQLDLLAGIVEEGRYAEGSEQELSFSNTIVLWTSNWGEHIIRDRTASNQSIRQQLRRELTEPKGNGQPVMRRRIWSRIEGNLWALRPFTERQLYELALVHAQEHTEQVKAVTGVELRIDPRLLLRLIAYESEAQAGARSILAQLESQVFVHYQDALAQPGVEKMVMLQVNRDVMVFTNLDPDFQQAWAELESLQAMSAEELAATYGSGLGD